MFSDQFFLCLPLLLLLLADRIAWKKYWTTGRKILGSILANMSD
jgi:hypothetical protein